MQARIWGCRGSLASPGPETLRYGGNTSCVEIRGDDDGTSLVLDGGTGIRALGLGMAENAPQSIHLLLTHLHLDHIEGIGFFAPVWREGTELHVWGPPSPVRRLEDRIAGYLSPPLFPVHLTEFPARFVFHDIPAEPWELAGIRISAQPVEHPGPTVGYRLEHGGRSLAYIPDHEPGLAVDLSTLEEAWISGLALAADADVLLHDAQWFEEEYRQRVGWGHSSIADAVGFARRADAARVLLFHHDPLHADDDLERLLDRARELWDAGAERLELAREGMELVV